MEHDKNACMERQHEACFFFGRKYFGVFCELLLLFIVWFKKLCKFVIDVNLGDGTKSMQNTFLFGLDSNYYNDIRDAVSSLFVISSSARLHRAFIDNWEWN